MSSDFKGKMHQIRFPLGLRSRPRWGSLQRSPAVFKGAGLLLRGVRGKGGGEEKGKEREGEGGKGRERIGRKGGEGKEERGGEWEHAPIGILESRRLWIRVIRYTEYVTD